MGGGGGGGGEGGESVGLSQTPFDSKFHFHGKFWVNVFCFVFLFVFLFRKVGIPYLS